MANLNKFNHNIKTVMPFRFRHCSLRGYPSSNQRGSVCVSIAILVFIFVAIFVGVMIVYSGKSQKPRDSFASTEPLQIVNQESEIVSPDGKAVLLVNQKSNDDNVFWTFSVGDDQLYQENLPKDVLLSVPFNTFSPDNKYIFIKKTSINSNSYIVLSTNGTSILPDGSTLEISSLFNARYPDFEIADVTGWAAPTLIVVNTNESKGKRGPSFWFDVSTRSFIRLSTRFD